MGSSQSTPANITRGEKVLERLNAQQFNEKIKQADEDEYVQIDATPSRYKGSETVSIATAEAWEKELLADPKNRLALSALLSNPVESIISQKVATLADTQTFNIAIPFEGAPITNQRSSGRCWLFAATNTFRIAIMKKHNLKEFELSQAYLFFWDKLEKANWFLEQIMETADQDLDSRLIQELLTAPVNDGGQWDMVVNLVEKYGLVPQNLFPDSYNAMNSSAMGSILTKKLREDALILRAMSSSTKRTSKSSLLSAKAKMMQEIHCILTLMLGPPPKPDTKFSWEFYDAAGKYHDVSKTPLEFAKELSSPSLVRTLHADISTLFSLVNDPRNAYNRLLTVSRLGNVVGGRPITYVNVDMPTMKNAAISMLKAGLPIFFGSDVGKFSNSTSGIMDLALYDYNLAFNISLGMNKAQRLRARDSAMTHAMVLTAVHVEDGKSVRWRVQNSWGETSGEKGYFVMTDAWMDEYVYQVVVDPSYVSKEVRDVLSTTPLVLPLWDPMGALA
jgi:bleomycin hydrolase